MTDKELSLKMMNLLAHLTRSATGSRARTTVREALQRSARSSTAVATADLGHTGLAPYKHVMAE